MIFANSGNSKASTGKFLKVEIAIAKVKVYFAIITVKITFHFIEHFIAINVCIFTHKLLLEICNCPWEKCFAKSLTNDIDNLNIFIATFIVSNYLLYLPAICRYFGIFRWKLTKTNNFYIFIGDIRCDTLVSDLQTIANFGFHLKFSYDSNA